MGAFPDLFESAYSAGVVEAQRAVPPSRRGGAALELIAPDGFALGGCVLTPTDRIDPGFVIVQPDGTIAAVETRRPESVPVLETEGVILPGLIDLHGHPDFNVFAPWEPPELYANRYQWRTSELYHQLVRDPQNRLLATLPRGTETRYAEIRALVGGVTAIQGATAASQVDGQGLVRKVDLAIFGDHRARSMIDLPADGSPGMEALRAILDDIAAGRVDAFYLHLAEGRGDDAESIAEFERFLELDALSAATVVIHGTALGSDELGQLAQAGAALVWSPQSELRLYGQTTAAATALDLGLPVGLGADWLPTGSPSLLAELKVARRVLARDGHPLEPQALVAMVTTGAAAIAGLDQHLGSLAVGLEADLVVLERHHDDPWHNVVEAEPSWVELVSVGGDLSYGRADWIAGFDAEAPSRLEAVTAWGKDMLLDTTPALPRLPVPTTLGELRTALIAAFPQVGPIFA